MPQRITCNGCGKILYEGELLKSPDDIIKKYEGRCPYCDKVLKFDAEKVEVKPSEE